MNWFDSIFCLVFLLFSVPCFAQSAGSVVFVAGAAVIVAKDGQARPVVRGAEFYSGETIDTADGRVQLRFLDGASMSLQPATRFRIEDFRFVAQDGKAGADDRGIFSLIKGGFRTITGLIGKQRREQYRVDTVVATIGIRGTDYSAQLGDAGLSVSTFGGLVEVCSGAGCVQVGPGDTAVVPERDSRPLLQGQLDGALDGSAVPGLPSSPVVSPEVVAPVVAPTRQMPNTYNY
jgi:hypothetical protein